MIHVGSILGKHAFPYLSTYCGSKAFNDKFIESINYEDICIKIKKILNNLNK